MTRVRTRRLGSSRIAGLGEQLGVHPEALRTWVKQAETDQGLRPGLTTDDQARIGDLERENRELRRANTILRQASVNSTRQRNIIEDHLGGVVW